MPLRGMKRLLPCLKEAFLPAHPMSERVILMPEEVISEIRGDFKWPISGLRRTVQDLRATGHERDHFIRKRVISGMGGSLSRLRELISCLMPYLRTGLRGTNQKGMSGSLQA